LPQPEHLRTYRFELMPVLLWGRVARVGSNGQPITDSRAGSMIKIARNPLFYVVMFTRKTPEVMGQNQMG